MAWLLLSCITVVVALLVAVVAMRSRRAAVGVAVLGVFAPLVLDPAVPLVRALAVHATVFVLMRAIDLVVDPRPRRLPWVLASLLLIGDLRTGQPIRPRLDRAAALAALAYLALAAAGVALAFRTSHPVTHWLGGLLLIYASADGLCAAYRFIATALGIRFATMHDVPIAARTIREFWGRRWNLTVSRWLHRRVFVPLRRRAPSSVALLAGFALSAALHVWLVLVPAGLAPALTMGGFFLLQGVAAWLEGPLAVRRWPPAWQRVWTASVLLASSPLFVGPFLQIVAI